MAEKELVLWQFDSVEEFGREFDFGQEYRLSRVPLKKCQQQMSFVAESGSFELRACSSCRRRYSDVWRVLEEDVPACLLLG